jgi:hypothetical protein
VVAHAEQFVQTVERVFGLEVPTRQFVAESDSSEQGRPPSLEETQREAALKWRRDYYDMRASGLAPDVKPAGAEEKNLGIDKTHPGLDTGLDFDPED